MASPFGQLLSETDELALSNFRSYLRINTMQPAPNYREAIQFLQGLGHELGLAMQVREVVAGKPILLMTLAGSDPLLPGLLLNSHMDVVPVSAEHWSQDPFAANVMENGDIVARGAQDMKCVGIAYLEALRRMLAAGFRPRRSIHLFYTPDEEVGSEAGAAAIVASGWLDELNIGFGLDEGIPSPFHKLFIFNCERSIWCIEGSQFGSWISYCLGIKVVAHGAAGHGSSLIQGTSTERLLKCLLKFSEWRDEQSRKLAAADGDLGSVTSVNITMLQAGKQCNVIPDTAEASIDIRITASDSIDSVKERVSRCCEGTDMTWSFLQRFDEGHGTLRNDSDGQLEAIKRALSSRGIESEVKTFPGATDSRFYRRAGIPCFGISPFRHTPILLHDHDEFVNATEFLDGIESYSQIIRELDALS